MCIRDRDFKVLHLSNIGRVYTVIVRGEPEAVVKAITDGKDSPQVVDCLLYTSITIFFQKFSLDLPEHMLYNTCLVLEFPKTLPLVHCQYLSLIHIRCV